MSEGDCNLLRFPVTHLSTLLEHFSKSTYSYFEALRRQRIDHNVINMYSPETYQPHTLRFDCTIQIEVEENNPNNQVVY